MQNTSKIPNIPNTLVKNFFIAGVNQKTLASKILENKAFNIFPEVLFTLYQNKDRVNNYLQFVFPENIAVEYQGLEPKFYSFMTTDQDGFNTFIHVLIFYEEINEAEISSNDFDIISEILRKQHLNKHNRNQSNATNAQQTNRGNSDLQGIPTLYNVNRQRHQEKLKHRNDEKCFQLNAKDLTNLQTLNNNEDLSITRQGKNNNIDRLIQRSKEMNKRKQEEQKLQELKKKEKMEKVIQDLNLHGVSQVALNTNNQSEYRTQSMQNTGKLQVPETPINGLMAQQKSYLKTSGIFMGDNSIINIQNEYITKVSRQPHLMNSMYYRPKSSAFKLPDVQNQSHINSQIAITEETLQDEPSVNFSTAVKVVKRMTKPQTAIDDYYGMMTSQTLQFGLTPIGNAGQHREEPIPFQSRQFGLETGGDDDLDFDEDYQQNNRYFIEENLSERKNSKREQLSDNNNLQYSQEQDDQLEKLYARKRYVPVALCLETETEYHDVFRRILLALFDEIRVPENVVNNRIFENRRLAFAELVAHLAFLRTIPAPPFNSIYNIYCLNQVFQIRENPLDQLPNKNSYPIKILFDVLDVRSIFYCWKALLFDKSFYVAEALKQLLFPMTWQNTYIQPGNINLAGHCDGTMVCLYGSNSMVNGFDFFDGMSPEMAVCDIDACYVNNISLPCIPDETMYIRILNTLKNSRINQYDKAYPDTHIPESEDFVNQVRETFFGLLKPFLSRIEKYIDTSIDPSQAYFSKYFNQKEYLNDYKDYGNQHYQFAQALLQSSQFVHFCDDYFNDELNNYKMLQEIYKSRGEIQETNFQDIPKRKQNIYQSVTSDDLKYLNKKEAWPEVEPVVFNFRMPKDDQRFMLFEKILLMIEESMEKRQKQVTRETNEHIMNNKDSLMYDKIISDIKKLYPIKLKGTHKKYQAQSQKLLLQDQKRLNQGTESAIQNPYSKLPTYLMQKKSNQRIYRGSVDSYKFSEDSKFQVSRSTDKDLQKTLIATNRKLVQKKSSTRLQLDLLVSNHDDTSQSPNYILTNTILRDNSMIEQEQERIQNCKFRISKLMYGKQGLISFMHHLFGLLEEKQMKRVNYYFALKNQIRELVQKIKDEQKHNLQLRENHPIQEENEDDNSPRFNSQSQYNRDRIKTLNQHTREQYKSPIRIQVGDPLQKPRNNTQHKSSLITSNNQISLENSNASKVFPRDSSWFSIDLWEANGKLLRYTQQFILFKVKMIETFECPEDGYSFIWKELLKFPSSQLLLFPELQFMHIWQNLTYSQQSEQFTKIAQKHDSIQKRLICQSFKKQEQLHLSTISVSQLSGNHKEPQLPNDENIFTTANIEKTYVQKINEKKKSNSSSKINQTSKQHSQPINDIKASVFKEKKRSRQEQNSQQQSLDLIKQRLEVRQSKTSSKQSVFGTSTKSSKRDSLGSGRHFYTSEHNDINIKSRQGSDLSSSPGLTEAFTKQKSLQSMSVLSKNDKLSVFQDYNMGKKTVGKESSNVQVMKDCEQISQHLLRKIVKFWEQNAQYVDKKGAFKENEVDTIQEELRQYGRYFKHLQYAEPELENDTIKQVFFLNLFNFLVLYYLALQMICNPEAVLKLNNFNMTQAFLLSCTMKLNEHKISAYSILFSILRPRLLRPDITEFYLETPTLPWSCQKFQVINPTPLQSFGIFLPLKRLPRIKIFRTKSFEEQLRHRANQYLSKKLRIKETLILLFFQNTQDGILMTLDSQMTQKSLNSLKKSTTFYLQTFVFQGLQRVNEGAYSVYRENQQQRDQVRQCSDRVQRFLLVISSYKNVQNFYPQFLQTTT